MLPGQNGWFVASSTIDELEGTLHQGLEAPVEKLERIGKTGLQRVQRSRDVSIQAGKLSQPLGEQFQSGAAEPGVRS